MKPLNVLYSEQLADRPSKRVRIIEPLERLQRAGRVHCAALERTAGDDTALDATDLLFLYVTDLNAASAQRIGPAIERALRAGKGLVCDADDHYFIRHGNSPFDDPLGRHLPLFRSLIASAHAVTVTGGYLREEMRAYNPNVLVLPNCVDLGRFPSRARGGEAVHVGWCGGPTHLHDLTLVLPALRRIQQRHDVDVTLFGLFDEEMAAVVERARNLGPRVRTDDPYLASFLSFAQGLDGLRYRHRPAVAFSEFPRALAELDLDIGLCPLTDTRYNRCKSAIKFYQYAAVGTATVASHVHPYEGECDYLAPNTDEGWYDALLRLVEDRPFSEELAGRQRDYVRSHRSSERVLPLYDAALSGIARRLGASALDS